MFKYLIVVYNKMLKKYNNIYLFIYFLKIQQ